MSSPVDLSILDMSDEWTSVSTLNPKAAAFVPSYYQIDNGSIEARLVDDLTRSVHHGLSVYDSDMLQRAESWVNHEFDLDHETALACDRETDLRAMLHAPAQKPKGNSSGRKKSRC